jgi:hypothetical protein
VEHRVSPNLPSLKCSLAYCPKTKRGYGIRS